MQTIPQIQAQLQQDYHLSIETLEALECYVTLLLQWNRAINLIGTSTEAAIWQRHILDCAQLLPQIPPHASIVDIGSGAGLPGLVLALCCPNPITLVESDAKKVAFLRHVISELKIMVELIHSRVEIIDKTFDIVTARALASVEKLCQYSLPLLNPGGFCLYLKGEGAMEEINVSRGTFDFDVAVMPSITHPHGNIVKISNLKTRLPS